MQRLIYASKEISSLHKGQENCQPQRAVQSPFCNHYTAVICFRKVRSFSVWALSVRACVMNMTLLSFSVTLARLLN